MAKVKIKRKENKATVIPTSKINFKNNISSDTLFVSDPKDKRIKSYQDSLQLSSRKQMNPNPIISPTEFEKKHYKGAANTYKERGISPIGFRDFSETPYRASEPVFAKPKRRVEYKKLQSKKEEYINKKEQPKPVEVKQNIYEGSPVYSPGAGSGMPSALVGFRNKGGEVTYIKPEDYKRFAVPEYGKKFIESKNSK